MIDYSYMELIEMLRAGVMSDIYMSPDTREAARAELDVLVALLWAHSE